MTAQGGPRPHPSLARGSGPTENAVDPPNTQVDGVRMRPREFLPYHKDKNSSSSTNIRALRVREKGNRALGLGLQGHTPTGHEVTFTTRHHPYDVMTTPPRMS